MRQSSISSIECNIGQEFEAARREMVADMLAWVNDGGEAEDYPGEGWDDPERFEPTPLERAELLGYEWGRDGGGRPDVTDLSITLAEHEARARGYLEGRRAYIRAQAEYEAWLDGLALQAEMDDRYAYFHPNEVVEAVGSVEARGFIELEGGGW